MYLPPLTHSFWFAAAGAALGFVLDRFVGLGQVEANLAEIVCLVVVAPSSLVPEQVGARPAGEPV
jgi:hypothetical protein